jgi:rSAM/selenodomain-associated transferase 1
MAGNENTLQEHVILFTRYPEPGRTKTRLIPALGAKGAADVQRRMTEQVVSRMVQLRDSRPVAMEIRYEGGDLLRMREWLNSGIDCRPQGGGDLGDRLTRAFEDAFRDGKTGVIAMGSDCPALTAEIMAQALEHLRRNDLVLGPAEDGGYYLIGMRRNIPELFVDIPWGTEEVHAVTLALAGKLNLSVAFTQPLADVDRPEDLRHFQRAIHP